MTRLAQVAVDRYLEGFGGAAMVIREAGEAVVRLTPSLDRNLRNTAEFGYGDSDRSNQSGPRPRRRAGQDSISR